MKYTLNLDNSMTFDAGLISGDTIEFRITAPKHSWVAVGFGDRLKNSDVFLIMPKEGIPTLIDAHSLNNKEILEDEFNDYKLSYTSDNDTNLYKVTRLLDTGDSEDYNITDKDHHMLYAYGNSENEFRYDPHDGGELDLLLNITTRDLGLRSPSMDPAMPRRKLLGANGIFHGLVSYIIWCVFSFLLIFTGRYGKQFYVTRMWAHTVLGIIILILNIMLSGITPSSSNSANFLGDIHEGMASACTLITIIVIAIGTLTRLGQVFLKHWTQLTIYMRWAHLLGGYFAIVYGHLGVLTGLYLYDTPLVWLFYVHLVIFIVIYTILEVLFWTKNKWKYEDLKMLEKNNLSEISLAEFEQFIKDGKKYCLMDKYVLDISYYRFEHPGTTYVMDRNIGKDVGKYFYGSYSMEDSCKPYLHSYIAGLTLKKLAIAKIKDKVDEGIVIANPDEKSVHSQGSHNSNRAMEADIKSADLNNVYTVESKYEIMKDTYGYKLSNGDVKFKSYYPNLSQSGRGYVISSNQNQISRYYTICNCMNEKYLGTYLDAFNSILEGTALEKKLSDPIHEEYDSFVEFIIKVYYETKVGVARQLDEATFDDKFIVEGPMGSNLNFGFPNAEGTYLLFVGGTGILPFMDIFAYMVRKLMAEKSEVGSIFPGETFESDMSKVNFVVYGYYPDEARACGYEFTKKVADVFEKLGAAEQFQFNCVWTKAGGKRLNKPDLEDLLKKHTETGEVKRLWVCGPPSMNNMFHKYMGTVKKLLNIHEEHIDIL